MGRGWRLSVQRFLRRCPCAGRHFGRTKRCAASRSRRIAGRHGGAARAAARGRAGREGGRRGGGGGGAGGRRGGGWGLGAEGGRTNRGGVCPVLVRGELTGGVGSGGVRKIKALSGRQCV